MVLGKFPPGKFPPGKYPLIKLSPGRFPPGKFPPRKFPSGIFPPISLTSSINEGSVHVHPSPWTKNFRVYGLEFLHETLAILIKFWYKTILQP